MLIGSHGDWMSRYVTKHIFGIEQNLSSLKMLG